MYSGGLAEMPMPLADSEFGWQHRSWGLDRVSPSRSTAAAAVNLQLQSTPIPHLQVRSGHGDQHNSRRARFKSRKTTAHHLWSIVKNVSTQVSIYF